MKLKGVLIDLHIHLDGSLSIPIIKCLARLNNVSLPNDETLKTILSVSDDCNDLNEYLKKFHLPISLLQTKESLKLASKMLCDELKNQGLMYAEIRFAPQLHTQQGLSQTEVVEAVLDGIRLSDFHANLILCCMRGNKNFRENSETLNLTKRFLNNGVCAIDLAGAEGLYKTNKFNIIFEKASRQGLPITIHCGEADGPSSISSAIAWHPKRLGHGIRILEDLTLTRIISERDVFFELCPTSNINTKVVSSYGDFPIRKMLKHGLRVTINTDNLTVSNTSLEKEFHHLIDNFLISKEEVPMLITNSINAYFASNEEKKFMIERLLNHKF